MRWFVWFNRIMTNSAPLIRTRVSGAGYNYLFIYFFFFFFISRPNCTDLPCFFNGPIVKLGHWHKQLSCCICDIKQDVLHGSCKPWLLFCLITTISAIINTIRSLRVNNYSSITVIQNRMINIVLQRHCSSGFCFRFSVHTPAFVQSFNTYIMLHSLVLKQKKLQQFW